MNVNITMNKCDQQSTMCWVEPQTLIGDPRTLIGGSLNLNRQALDGMEDSHIILCLYNTDSIRLIRILPIIISLIQTRSSLLWVWSIFGALYGWSRHTCLPWTADPCACYQGRRHLAVILACLSGRGLERHLQTQVKVTRLWHANLRGEPSGRIASNHSRSWQTRTNSDGYMLGQRWRRRCAYCPHCESLQYGRRGWSAGNGSGYIVGFGLVEMAISTNPKPTICRNLYENTGPVTHLYFVTHDRLLRG